MEGSQDQNVSSFQQQLQNLQDIQNQIERTKKELSQLGKIQLHEDKNLQSIYQLSVETTRNKLNLYEVKQNQENIEKNNLSELKAKREKVRELRERKEQNLKQVREMLKKSKEQERLVIRNNSIRYDQTINRNRKKDRETKQKMVQEARREKENYKLALQDSRLQQTKKKQVELFRQTLAKIQRQPTLLKELEELTKKKELAESRVLQRKNIKKQVCQSLEKLRSLNSSQVRQIVVEEEIEGDETVRRSFEEQTAKEKKLLKCVESIDNLKLAILEKKPDFKMKI